ncbi:hypothetical protein ACFYO1_08075 [Nocardia sp. NPDC006044]|uniref:hypothetical protein n=1 Tax=Nocardia sp. NPDC006044 TaxID=3364306 RepID=UPI0036C98F0D
MTDMAHNQARVPAIGAIRRSRALVAFGHPHENLAQELGISLPEMQALTAPATGGASLSRQQIPAELHQSVAVLFDRLQMSPGPSDDARLHARKRAWPLPFQWDEDAIDDPAAQPIRCRRVGRDVKARSAEREAAVLAELRHGATTELAAERLHLTARSVQRILAKAGGRSAVERADRAQPEWELSR